MGRQVNFYMMESDEQEFLRFVRSDREVCISMTAVPSSEPVPFTVLPDRRTPGWFALFLWDVTNSPPPKLEYIREQNHYVVDEYVSEVIEFHRSTMHEDCLVRGRIWAQIKYWDLENDPPEIVTKSEHFQKWYNRLANWIKRRSIRDERGDYVLPGAAKYAKQGGRLVQALFAKSVKVFYHDVDDTGSGSQGQ